MAFVLHTSCIIATRVFRIFYSVFTSKLLLSARLLVLACSHKKQSSWKAAFYVYVAGVGDVGGNTNLFVQLIVCSNIEESRNIVSHIIMHTHITCNRDAPSVF